MTPRRCLLALSTSLTLALTLAGPALADEIWVTNELDDTISVIDVDTLAVTATYPTGQRPRGVTFSRDFSRLMRLSPAVDRCPRRRGPGFRVSSPRPRIRRQCGLRA